MSSSDESEKLQSMHNHAQRLNNRGAAYIEVGRYNSAIPLLLRALKIQEAANNGCCCYDEGCEKFSSTSLDCSLSYSCQITLKHNNNVNENRDDENGRYMHRQPIRIPPEFIHKGLFIGPALPLIITFNLALGIHLYALQQNAPAARKEKLRKALKLYELAYRLQMKENQRLQCVRFTIILANNLAEIHRATENYAKQRLCLQHLLSALMFVVDNKQQLGATVAKSGELDGFFRNTSQLIFPTKSQCASAA